MTKEDLLLWGYTIWNAKVRRVKVELVDHIGPCITICLDGERGCVDLNVSLKYHTPECIRTLIKVTDCWDLCEAAGSCVRVCSKDCQVYIIGHVCDDVWFRVYNES